LREGGALLACARPVCRLAVRTHVLGAPAWPARRSTKSSKSTRSRVDS